MNFQMINVAEKAVTHRRAIAEGRIFASRQTISRIKEKSLPKGDPLPLAEAAGIMAAKRTSETLPLCHPLSLDSVRVECVVELDCVVVSCEAIAYAKTGVEMEALNGAMAALLCIYDLTKGIDPALTIEGVYLKIKEGGKSGVWVHPKEQKEPKIHPPKAEISFTGARVDVVTLSDRCSKGLATDESGPLIAEFFRGRDAQVSAVTVIPDEKSEIQRVIVGLLESRPQIICLTGGTGIGPRDVTPEAVTELGARWIPGIGELLRSSGSLQTQNAWLSRGGAAVIGSTLLLLLPGSPKAVRHGLSQVERLAKHSLGMIVGDGHP